MPVTKANVAEIAACGRARWKIENESFNVLKNYGYELEHNFGHGETYLAMTLAALNVLAFAWHTVLDLLEPPWRKAREAAEKRMSFFAYLANPDQILPSSLPGPISSKPSPPSQSRQNFSKTQKIEEQPSHGRLLIIAAGQRLESLPLRT